MKLEQHTPGCAVRCVMPRDLVKVDHYCMRFDPMQCHSSTARGAERLQTLPDDYLFEGTRTQPYARVWDALPPLLGHQIARVVRKLLISLSRDRAGANSGSSGIPRREVRPLVIESDRKR